MDWCAIVLDQLRYLFPGKSLLLAVCTLPTNRTIVLSVVQAGMRLAISSRGRPTALGKVPAVAVVLVEVQTRAVASPDWANAR